MNVYVVLEGHAPDGIYCQSINSIWACRELADREVASLEAKEDKADRGRWARYDFEVVERSVGGA
jgi:hypothetical protein